MVVGYPLGRSTSKAWRSAVVVIIKTAVGTIWHAICLLASFLHTCVEWTLSRCRVHLYYPTLFLENREKRNPYDWRTRARLRSCARLAGPMFRGNWRVVPSLLTSIDGLSVTWSAVRSYSQTKAWTTYLLVSAVNSGALRCFADPLQDRCLSCVCPSYDKHSKLEIWDSTTGLFSVHWCDGI